MQTRENVPIARACRYGDGKGKARIGAVPLQGCQRGPWWALCPTASISFIGLSIKERQG